MPDWNLSPQQVFELVKLLLACPSIADSSSRVAIVAALPRGIQWSYRQGGRTDAELHDLVRMCLNYPSGLDTLIETVRGFEGNSYPMQALDGWLVVARTHSTITPLAPDESSNPIAKGSSLPKRSQFPLDQEHVDSQLQLLTIHRRTLDTLLQQRAKLTSAYIPPAVAHGIHEARDAIQQIKNTLRGWEITVGDQPGDEEGDHR